MQQNKACLNENVAFSTKKAICAKKFSFLSARCNNNRRHTVTFFFNGGYKNASFISLTGFSFFQH